MQGTDIMMHVNEQLTTDQRQDMESQLRQIEGVIAPRFNKAHLLLIYYNMDKTSSSILLNFVRSKGYETQLVGI